jgi:hypothetical protein
MGDLPQAPVSQHVPTKLVALILGVAAYVVAALAVLQFYSEQLGLLMLAPVLVGFVVAYLRVPREQWVRIAAAKKKQKRTVFGRIVWIAEIVALLYVAIIVSRWLYERL